ncbi:MAG: Gfo/Idh/MocA family oxidoreductase [Firmicutes bacterium]|nr:Gfo/Idh/MocA family oxidoreductase [Bacillota bacterium]MDH7495159.1 Gfo/Idh/MocA family oxidoreductase [Bacillota bacterium]
MVNVGVIGCGNWGKNYVRNFSEIPEAKLVTCCDTNHARLMAIRERYPLVKLTKSFQTVASDPKIDAVVVATPPETHYAIARACLLRGKHVLVEKPFTLSSEDADHLVDIATKAGKVLMVGHIMDYHPALRVVKDYVAAGELGKVYYLHATRTSLGIVREDVSVLWDKAPHDIATLLYLLEDEPVSVAATGEAYVNDGIEDVAFVTIRFSSGVMANIHLSWLDPCKASRTTIIGEKKMIVFDDAETLEKVKVYNKGVNRRRDFTKKPEGGTHPNGVAEGSDSVGDATNGVDTLNGFSGFQYTFTYGDVYIPKLKMSEPLRNECLHFLECIREGKRPLTDGVNGAKVVRVLERAEESLRRGGEYVPIDSSVAAAGAREGFMAKARLFWKGLGF